MLYFCVRIERARVVQLSLFVHGIGLFVNSPYFVACANIKWTPMLTPSGAWVTKKTFVKIHDSSHELWEMAFDWLADVLPANKKPGLNVLVS